MSLQTITCSRHGKLPKDQFYIYQEKEGKQRIRCKRCIHLNKKRWKKADPARTKESMRKWRAKNKKRLSEYVLSKRKKIIAYVFSFLKTHPCVDCGESDPVVLEFDHVRGKKYKCISKMVAGRMAIATIQKEIDKCEVRCANCHKRKTAKQLGFYKLSKEFQ